MMYAYAFFIVYYIVACFYFFSSTLRLPQAVGSPTPAAVPIEYPKNYFRSPLDIPLILAGTFGELRTNHFHAGIDIKTQGKEGYNIYACAEGYVSRIKISGDGYGKTLYITHPNGYTTVYAHLSRLNGAIADYVRTQQYAQQQFEIDLAVPAGVLAVQKGQVVALSGNTGSSTAPHLHFEIRDTATEAPINPLLFGFDVGDTRSPVIQQVNVLPLDLAKRINGSRSILPARALGGGNYALSKNDIVMTTPFAGITVKTYDTQNASNNANGVYGIEIKKDGLSVFSFNMESFLFEHSRYINSHIDYDYDVNGGAAMHRCYVEPGNRLPVYNNLIQSGAIDLSDGATHQIEIIVRDAYNNTSRLNFAMRSTLTNQQMASPLPGTYRQLMYQGNPARYTDGTDFEAIFAPDAFYDDVYFKHSRRATTSSSIYSDIHSVHEVSTPVHSYFDIGIVPRNLPETLRDKALIVRKSGSREIPLKKTRWDNEFLIGQDRQFGDFYVATDNTPPTIKVFKNYEKIKLSPASTVQFNIYDGLSGIASFNAYVDEQWNLMDYDKKTGALRGKIDVPLSAGTHQFRLEVRDDRGNLATKSFDFLW